MGRGVDRVRGKQEETPGVNNNRVQNSNGNLDRDSYSLPQDRYGRSQEQQKSRDKDVSLVFV